MKISYVTTLEMSIPIDVVVTRERAREKEQAGKQCADGDERLPASIEQIVMILLMFASS